MGVFLSPYSVYNSMNKLDRKIRRFLVDEGYLFPTTDEEIERSIIEAKAQGIEVPKHLDYHNIYFGHKNGRAEKRGPETKSL